MRTRFVKFVINFRAALTTYTVTLVYLSTGKCGVKQTSQSLQYYSVNLFDRAHSYIDSFLTAILNSTHQVFMDVERLQRLANAVRTGGKGSVRRKKKAAHKVTSGDDTRLQNCLRRMQVNTIPGIEEVNIFQGENVIHFANPKVQASAPANTYVVSGVSQSKALQDILPGVLNQLGPENLASLKKMAEQYSKSVE